MAIDLSMNAKTGLSVPAPTVRRIAHCDDSLTTRAKAPSWLTTLVLGSRRRVTRFFSEHRQPDQSGKRLGAGFLHYGGAMILDCTLADSKIRGNDFVRMSGQDEVHDLTLSRRESCEGRSDVILPPFRLFRLLTRFERPHDGRQQFSAVRRDCVRRPCSEGLEDRWPDAASFDQDPPRTAMLNQLLIISVALSGVVGEHENDDQIGTFIGEGRCPDFAEVGGEG
jgi:hypothetical protein